MDPEFPKTVNSAVAIAGKVHGSLTELETLFASLRAELGELTSHMTAALGAMKAAPDLPPAPVPAPKPVESKGPVKPVATSTPEK
jgi:hypothetical protein